MDKLKNKTAVLTGATGGIGKPIAIGLARQQVNLVLVGRDESSLKALTVVLPGNHHYVVADISTQAGVNELARQCEEKYSIDMLINCAGVNQLRCLEDQEADMVETIIRTNMLAPILVCKALLPQLKQCESAIILNVGSVFGSIGYPGYASYCASKFGLRGFTESLRRELSDSRVIVHYLSPRAVNTAMNNGPAEALNRQLKTAVDDPEVVVSAVLKQLRRSSGSDKVLGWPEKLFVKINQIFPKLVNQNIAKQLATIRRFAEKPASVQ